MAGPNCMTEGHGPAKFIGTFMEDGSSVALCDECMPTFCAAVFERMTGVDMTPALYLASVEGDGERQTAPGDPQEVAYPPDMEPKGNTASEAPAAAPADTDPAAVDPTSADASEPAAQSTGGGDAPEDAGGPGDGSPGAPPSETVQAV